MISTKSVRHVRQQHGPGMEPWGGRGITETSHKDPAYAVALGQRLKLCAARVETQAELARRSGVPLRNLSRYIAGTHQAPAEAIARLAHAAEVSPGWLLTGEGEPTRPERAYDRGLFRDVVLATLAGVRVAPRPLPPPVIAEVLFALYDLVDASPDTRAMPALVSMAQSLLTLARTDDYTP